MTCTRAAMAGAMWLATATCTTEHSPRALDPASSQGDPSSGQAEAPGDAPGADDSAGGHSPHHGHDDGEASDLDRSVDELLGLGCEHGTKAYLCAECRYEVGVVKVPARLFAEGLLRRAQVVRQPVAVPLELTGEVQFDQRHVSHVSTQAEGIIRRVEVTLGDRVERGQALLVIESVIIGEVQAEYLQAVGLLDLARRTHDRQVALRKEGIASEKGLLEAKHELDLSRIRVDAATGKLLRLGMGPAAVAALQTDRANGRLVLRAPTAGTVLALHAVAGEVARSEQPLATVGDNASLWVWADLYERDIAVVMREQSRGALVAEVTVSAFADHVFAGHVDFINPAMSASSRTVKIRIAVPNPEGLLLAGMFARARVFVTGDEQALVAPSAGVLEDDGRHFVFVHQDGPYFIRRPVEIGVRQAGVTTIRGGLLGGETVVGEGAFLLKSDVLRSKMGAGCAD